MSLQDVRVKLEAGLDDIYTALEEKSATIPEQKNLINVAPAIRSISGAIEEDYLLKYIPVEYIETTGTQYIDTGYKVNKNSEFILKGYVADEVDKFLFGVGKAGAYVSAAVMIHTGVYRGRWRKSADSNVDVISTVPYSNTPHTFKLNKTSFYIDDVLIGNFNSTYNFTESYTTYIFGWNSLGSVGIIPTKGRIYSFKIYDNGSLVRDFVPCLCLPDNKYGLYDLVNKKFYTNAGTGEFLGG